MSYRARSALSSAATGVATGIVLLCLGASLCASAQESTKGPDRPNPDGKATRTFRTGIGMTDVERMIDSSAGNCPIPLVVPGEGVLHFPPCSLVEKLQTEFAKSSENGSLIDFLQKNDFTCTKMGKETRCYNAFKRIFTARHPFTGEQMNPDIEETYITNVSFEQTKQGPLPARDIKVKFTRLTKQSRN